MMGTLFKRVREMDGSSVVPTLSTLESDPNNHAQIPQQFTANLPTKSLVLLPTPPYLFCQWNH